MSVVHSHAAASSALWISVNHSSLPCMAIPAASAGISLPSP